MSLLKRILLCCMFVATVGFPAIQIDATPYSTIQDALDNAVSDDVIVLDAGTYSGTGNVGLVWPNVQDVTLQGDTSANTILDGEDTYRIVSQNYPISWQLKNLTLRRGKSPSIGSSGDNRGGAILIVPNNANHLVTIDSCIISGNQAYLGGAIARQNNEVSSNVVMTNSSVYSNSAAYGGGFYYGTNTIINGKVYGNSAADAGGGFRLATNIITNSEVFGNIAINGGGFTDGTNTLINSKVYGNSASSSGGGFLYGTNTFTNSSVYGNSSGS
ncbi:MAG: hypothetical protein PHN69_05605, partial [Candidatus Pacebacteria bacterium]|nr:hypothetical protein [Candidatus Paceibacterota bacterium]